MNPTEIRCPDCRGTVPVEDLDLSTTLARCRSCNKVFSFGKFLPAVAAPNFPASEPSSDEDLERVELPLPRGLKIDEAAGRMKITRSWFHPTILFLAFFCLFWDGFLVVWYSIALTQGLWIMAVFPVIHVAVGIGLTYTVLLGFVNKTTFEIGHDRLKITHGPLPSWTKASDITAPTIAQLYVKRNVSHTKNGSQTNYELQAILADGRHVQIAENIENESQALYLEQSIEDFLGIEDAPVEGSYRPRTNYRTRKLLESSQVEIKVKGDCPVCGVGIHDPAVVCDRCSIPHHRDCWDYAGTCSTYGCTGSAFEVPAAN